MKPDLGLRYLKDGVNRNVAINFYDVPFYDIDFVAPNTYSVMFDLPHNGTDHALSFDFSDDIFAYLMALFSPEIRERFGTSLIGKAFPFSVRLPSPVTIPVVECCLGELQRGTSEEFVPFMITRLGQKDSKPSVPHKNDSSS